MADNELAGLSRPWNPKLDPELDGDYPERLRGWRMFARGYLARNGAAVAPKPSRRFPTGSSLYFLQAVTGEIKIGSAKNPQGRIKQLQTGSPTPLALLHIADGLGEMEREYHSEFDAHRLHGEWFAPHPDILAEIERLKGMAA